MVITRNHNGSLTLSDIVDGYWVRQTYWRWMNKRIMLSFLNEYWRPIASDEWGRNWVSAGITVRSRVFNEDRLTCGVQHIDAEWFVRLDKQVEKARVHLEQMDVQKQMLILTLLERGFTLRKERE